jgi:cytohesin
MQALLDAHPSLLADRDANGNMLLHNVVLEGDADVVEIILEKGCDVNARGLASITPLDLAIRRGDPEIVQLLLRHGADPKQESGQRQPLDRARELGDEMIVELIEAALGQTERP